MAALNWERQVRAHIRDNVPPEQLKVGLETLKILNNLVVSGGEQAAKMWAKEDMTEERKAALRAIAKADTDHCPKDERDNEPFSTATVISMLFALLA